VSEQPQINEHLHALVAAHGTELCRDHRRVEALLSETFPGRPRAAVVLHVAVREGIADELARGRSRIPLMVYQRMVRRLFDRAGITPGDAAWSVQTWADALGRTTPAVIEAGRIRQAPMLRDVDPRPVKRPKGHPRMLQGHRKAVTDLSFRPDGLVLASCSLDRTIRLWDPFGASLQRVLMGGHRDWIRTVAYSPDGKSIASGGDDGAIRLWSAETGDRVFRFSAHEDWVRTVIYSPDGSLVISGGKDGLVTVWEIDTLQQLNQIGPFEGGISRLCFHHDGNWLAIGSKDRVDLYDPIEARKIRELPAVGDRPCMASGHGDHLLVRDQLVIGDEENLISYDPNTGQELVRFLGHDGPVRSVSLHPNGMSMASGGVDKSVRVWDTGEGSQSYCFETGQRVIGVAFSPQHQLAMGFGDSQIMISDMREPRK
jgi:WD40 repeat protein